MSDEGGILVKLAGYAEENLPRGKFSKRGGSRFHIDNGGVLLIRGSVTHRLTVNGASGNEIALSLYPDYHRALRNSRIPVYALFSLSEGDVGLHALKAEKHILYKCGNGGFARLVLSLYNIDGVRKLQGEVGKHAKAPYIDFLNNHSVKPSHR